MVEQYFRKVKVVSSILTSGSNKKNRRGNTFPPKADKLQEEVPGSTPGVGSKRCGAGAAKVASSTLAFGSKIIGFFVFVINYK